MFITIVQLIALLTPDWRTPTQGIPVLFTMTLNALVGLFLAGAGGNMLWRERRMQMLAAGARSARYPDQRRTTKAAALGRSSFGLLLALLGEQLLGSGEQNGQPFFGRVLRPQVEL